MLPTDYALVEDESKHTHHSRTCGTSEQELTKSPSLRRVPPLRRDVRRRPRQVLRGFLCRLRQAHRARRRPITDRESWGLFS